MNTSNLQDPPELVTAMQEFFADNQQPAVTSKIEYRLYYDASGKVLFMTTNDEPGKYIVISKEVYNKPNYSSMRVVNGELKIVNFDDPDFALDKAATGYQTVKGHAGILADDQTTTETQTYGFKHN